MTEDNRQEEIEVQQLVSRISVLEKEVDKNKRLSIIANLIAILLGGTGLLGMIQWVFNGPSISRQLASLNVESKRLENQIQANKAGLENRTAELKSSRQNWS